MKQFLIGILLILCITATAFAEGSKMEVITISGPNGTIYGELQTPASDVAPLIILSHGFGGNHAFNQD